MGKKSLFRLMLWGSYKRPAVKIIIIFLLFIISLMVGITAALQFPEIQTKVARGLTNYLSKRIGLDVSIGHVNIYWLRNLELNDVLIKDVEQDTMIYAGSLKLIFNLSILKKGKDITLSEAELDRAYVRLVKYDPEGYLNINHLIDSLKSLTSGNNSDSVKGVFQIEKINLTNSTFLLSNPFKDSLAGKFNYNQFRLNDLNASGENLTSIGKDFSIQINSLNCSDSATSFPVNSLKGFYQITENSMVFRSFSLEAGNTSLDGSMVFQFDSIQLMSDFNENVAIIADIKESDIFSQDLGLFVPSFQKIWQRFDISGFFSGSINQFEVKNFNIGFGEGSHLKGTINAYGLPDIENTFMDLRVQNSLIRPNDLKPFISESSLRTLVKFGNSSFKGRFTGFISDFVADANFYTQIGYIDSDINLKVDPSNNQPTYSGRLLVQAFDLGKLVGQENLFQMIDLRGSVKGTGFDIETLDLFMDGSIENFGIKGYNYRNISMDGRLSSEVFNGFIGINDPNLIFEINGNINLHKGEEKINISASLDTAILHELNITDVEAAISTRIIADFEGLTIDDFVGSIRSEKTSVSYDQRRTDIENFKLISERNDSSKYLELSSNNIDFHMSGTYNLTDLFKDLPTLVKEYIVLIKNDKPTIDSLLANNKRSISKPYNFELNAYLVDINPALTLLFPDLYVAKNSFISGEFQGGDSSTLNFKASIDTLQYLNYLLTENELEFHGYRNRDSIETYATLNISSANQQFGTTETSGLKFESIWNYDSLYSSFYVRQIDKGNDITVNSLIELNPGFTRLRFLPSEIIVLNNQWRFSKDNEIHLAKRDIEFLNFKLGNEDQEIKIDGKVSQNSGDKLIVNVRNFRIENINSLITREFFGTVNGYATIDRVYTNPIIDSQFNIDHLVFQEFLVGDIEASSNYRVDDEVMDIEFHVLAEQKEKVIDVNGYYYPEKKENQLDLSATFNNANINLIEPFYDNLISDLDGRAQGNFKISGSIKYPVLKGEGTISKGNIRLNYLNTAYTFEGGIFFTENQIGAKNLVLTDRFNNTGMLNGSIKHEYFKNIRFDLTSQFQNLLVLNTSPLDNDLFYGTAFGTGILHVTGQDNNILMDINAVTNPGTKFYIPLSGSSEINQENYIQFIDYSDPKEVDDLNEENVFKLKGIRLDFDLEVTPDAYCEIIFDVKAGDIIRGRGNGKLNLSIDTKGEFNMFGDFEFESGGYNFTLYKIINKKFSI